MKKKRSYFTAEGYRRLARNPFVDRNMLQFIQDKAHISADDTKPTTNESRKRLPSTGTSKPVISEEAAKLIAAAISSMLRE